ncbi:magnesium transporter MgtE N-terminal domain-containing protein [Actinoplanes teichomyceticus]|nr:hypothetical protein [Actinoplanes teichomyceticus]
MIRRTPPQSAISMLTGLPPERFVAVAAALGGADVARLMLAAKPDGRARLLEMFADRELIRATSAVTPEPAATMLAGLPVSRLRGLFGELPEPVRSALLTALPAERRDELLGELDNGQAQGARAALYERAVTAALRRANTEVTVPAGAPAGIMYVRAYHRLVAVAVCRGDDGRTGVPAAENAAYRLRAHGALCVTDQPIDPQVRRYCGGAREQGRPLDVVTWAGERHDGHLKRTLATLLS